jgi:hypothetical protein
VFSFTRRKQGYFDTGKKKHGVYTGKNADLDVGMVKNKGFFYCAKNRTKVSQVVPRGLD